MGQKVKVSGVQIEYTYAKQRYKTKQTVNISYKELWLDSSNCADYSV